MDVTDLREFYATPLGGVVRRIIGRRVTHGLKNVRADTVVGLGYAIPYLNAWRGSDRRVIAFMPAHQGVIHWPEGGPWATALAHEAQLPLESGVVDILLVVHGLEMVEHMPAMLKELWRVLAPQGRALFVVPNRRGMWARFDSTPFGHGRPFSRFQLGNMLRQAQFSPVSWTHALFVPPINRRFIAGTAPAWERFGAMTSPAFSGVVAVEAVKQVYAALPHQPWRNPFGRRFRPLAPAGAT